MLATGTNLPFLGAAVNPTLMAQQSAFAGLAQVSGGLVGTAGVIAAANADVLNQLIGEPVYKAPVLFDGKGFFGGIWPRGRTGRTDEAALAKAPTRDDIVRQIVALLEYENADEARKDQDGYIRSLIGKQLQAVSLMQMHGINDAYVRGVKRTQADIYFNVGEGYGKILHQYEESVEMYHAAAQLYISEGRMLKAERALLLRVGNFRRLANWPDGLVIPEVYSRYADAWFDYINLFAKLTPEELSTLKYNDGLDSHIYEYAEALEKAGRLEELAKACVAIIEITEVKGPQHGFTLAAKTVVILFDVLEKFGLAAKMAGRMSWAMRIMLLGRCKLQTFDYRTIIAGFVNAHPELAYIALAGAACGARLVIGDQPNYWNVTVEESYRCAADLELQLAALSAKIGEHLHAAWAYKRAAHDLYHNAVIRYADHRGIRINEGVVGELAEILEKYACEMFAAGELRDDERLLSILKRAEQLKTFAERKGNVAFVWVNDNELTLEPLVGIKEYLGISDALVSV